MAGGLLLGLVVFKLVWVDLVVFVDGIFLGFTGLCLLLRGVFPAMVFVIWVCFWWCFSCGASRWLV